MPLLTHSSGLPRESDYPYWNAPKFDFPAREKMITQLKNQKTLYPANTYYQYSNLGLTLAGEIVAQVSGQDYEMYITENKNNPSSTVLLHNQDVNKTCIFWSAKDYLRTIETESLPAKQPVEQPVA